MGRFDGVAVMHVEAARIEVAGAAEVHEPVDPTDVAARRATAAVHVLRAVLAERGHTTTAGPRPGVPDVLRDTGGRQLIMLDLPAGTRAHRHAATHGIGGRGREPIHGSSPRLDDAGLAVLPPASTAGLVGCRPLAGGRTHVALVGQPMTVCGRLPVSGQPIDPGRVDCLRCRRSDALTERFAEQLAGHDDLADLVDPLTAAALARWWPRLDHRDPGDLPLLLDAMAGARLHALPGAPTTDEVLRQVRRHRAVASAAVRVWAAGQARPRLEQQLRRLLLDAGGGREAAVRRELALAGALLEPADVAETLVELLERHGPVPSLEPLVLDLARRAGDAASDRVQRWRRLHAIAAALTPGRHTPGRHPPAARPITHISGRARTGSHR